MIRIVRRERPLLAEYYERIVVEPPEELKATFIITSTLCLVLSNVCFTVSGVAYLIIVAVTNIR